MREGRPTTDPKAALAGGVVLPIGEHKGSGISMFMDIFGGVISGANFGGEVGDQYKAFDRAAGRRPLLPGDEARPVRLRGRLPRPHRHADRPHEVRAARRRLCRSAGAGRARGPLRGASAAGPAFPTRRARSRRCRTRPSAPASSRWWCPSGRSGLDGQPLAGCGNLDTQRWPGHARAAARRDIPGAQSGENNAQTAFPAARRRGPAGGAHHHGRRASGLSEPAGAADHPVPARRQQRRGRPHDRARSSASSSASR